MKVKLYSFTKQVNSVALPTASGTEVDVQVKSSISLEEPLLIIKTDTDDLTYNYAYIPKWNRYYFIIERVINNDGTTNLVFTEDYAGTWIQSIRSLTTYVTRSASDFNVFLQDSLWTHDCNIYTSDIELDIGLVDCLAQADQNNGSVIVQLVGKGSGASASSYSEDYLRNCTTCSTYVMDATGFKDFYKALIESPADSSWWATGSSSTTVDEATIALANEFYNPAQYIKNIFWMPFPYGESANVTCAVNYTVPAQPYILAKTLVQSGEVKLSLNANHNDDNPFTFQTTGSFGQLRSNQIEISWEMDNTGATMNCGQWNYTSWIDRESSWSNYEMYIPSIGNISLPTQYAGQRLQFMLDVDCLTGQSMLHVRSGSTTQWNNMIISMNGNMSVPMDLESYDYSNLASALASYGDAKFSKKVANINTTAVGTQLALNTLGGVGKIAGASGNYANWLDSMKVDPSRGQKFQQNLNLMGVGDRSSTSPYMASTIASTIEQQMSANREVGLAKSELEHSALEPTCNSLGSIGNKMLHRSRNTVHFYSCKYHVYDITTNQVYPKLISEVGGKCNAVKSLSGLSGFTQCVDPKPNMAGCTYTEYSSVVAMLESGVIL